MASQMSQSPKADQTQPNEECGTQLSYDSSSTQEIKKMVKEIGSLENIKVNSYFLTKITSKLRQKWNNRKHQKEPSLVFFQVSY